MAFQVGDQVEHAEYGRGEVVWVYRLGLQVEFIGGQRIDLEETDVQPFVSRRGTA